MRPQNREILPMKADQEFLNANNSFFRLFHLNHLIMGEDYEFIREFARKNEESFELDFSHYHMLLTGLRCKTIKDWAYLGTQEQINLYVKARRGIREYLMLHGYESEVFPADCIHSRQIVAILFPQQSVSASAEEAARAVSHVVYETYPKEQYMPTILLKDLTGKESVAPAFERLLAMERLAFFLGGERIITEELIRSQRYPFSERDALAFINEIEEEVFLGEKKRLEEKVKELFLNHLKGSQDLDLTEITLTQLRQKIEHWTEMFPFEQEMDKKEFGVDSYDFIEEIPGRILQQLTRFTQEFAKQEKGISCVTRDAVRFIKNNYLRDICQADVAENINVTRSHLSRMFNRDMGIGIPAYLTELRLEKAKELLRETSLKVSEVAVKTGFSDMMNFIRVFKKNEGITPGQYRNIKYRNARKQLKNEMPD